HRARRLKSVFCLVPTLRAGTPARTLRVTANPSATQSVAACVPTRSVGTRGAGDLMPAAQAISVPRREPSRVLMRLFWRLFRNSARLTLRDSGLRLLMILGLSTLIWLFVFVVSLEGFAFLQTQWPLSGG